MCYVVVCCCVLVSCWLLMYVGVGMLVVLVVGCWLLLLLVVGVVVGVWLCCVVLCVEWCCVGVLYVCVVGWFVVGCW